MSSRENSNLVKVTINGTEVQAEPGRLLIDVAEEMGVFVPRFCYHPGMKSVAVCRMCLVQVEGSPKLLPACATPVSDDMKVNTVDADAVEAQKDVLEFLLINHPLDCPICDRAGECPLQDQTYKHGPGSSRYVEEKRTFEKALEISSLVVLDRERCVLCWRCVRFSDEIAGDRFIQLIDRGDGTQILNFKDDPFDSYFSGNTIQICPVGALTSKPYRFVARPWDLETAPSVCGYCSVGCPITNESRQGSMVRCQALPNEEVNDFWICDKGRFAYHYVESKDRLETPLVREGDGFKAVAWAKAMQRVTEGLEGKSNVGVISGGHLTTEDAYAVAKLAKDVIGTPDIDSRIQDAGVPYEIVTQLAGVAGSNATMRDLKTAKNIVWFGGDPKENVPVLYLHIHTTLRDTDAQLFLVAQREQSLDLLAQETFRPAIGDEGSIASEVQGKLQEGDTIVCWAPAHPGRDESASLQAAIELAQATSGKLLVCPPHAGSQGMIDMGVHPGLDAGYKPAEKRGRDTRAILEAAANKELDALVIFGADVITDFPDRGLAERALEAGIFTVVVELFPTETALRADVVLPSAAYAEREGTFTNLERRLQKLEPLLKPPGTGREPWKAAQLIAKALGTEWGWRTFDDVWSDIRTNVPTHAEIDVDRLAQEAPVGDAAIYSTGLSSTASDPLALAGPGGQYPKGFRQGAPFQTGQNWPLSWELRAFEAKQRPGQVAGAPDGPPGDEGAEPQAPASSDETSGRFTLLTGRFIYDEGAMVSRTRALGALQLEPFIELNADDAKELGISEGDEVVIEGAGTTVNLPARVNGIAQGCVFVPYNQSGFRANGLMDGINPRVDVRRA
ncbi:MAG: NADH-quinone oxidoreductase subunit NuoG [Actinomycetota bacterium]